MSITGSVAGDFRRCCAGRYGLEEVTINDVQYYRSQMILGGGLAMCILAECTPSGVSVHFCTPQLAGVTEVRHTILCVHRHLYPSKAVEAFVHLALGLNCPYGD